MLLSRLEMAVKKPAPSVKQTPVDLTDTIPYALLLLLHGGRGAQVTAGSWAAPHFPRGERDLRRAGLLRPAG